ncbi:MAG: OmpP1/FadL family transporter [Bacteroidota bacterium]
MKKQISLTIIIFTISAISVFAQNIEYDAAVRNSQTTYGGTARFTGMGGAFNALGGDLSSLSINPAGVAVYSGLQVLATPVFHSNKTNTDMLGYEREETDYNFNFNNVGLVSSYEVSDESLWKNINFALGYNRLENFNNTFNVKYFNKDFSLMHTYVDNANNDNYSNDYEELAFQTYLLNDYYLDGTDTIYEWWSPVSDEMNYTDTASGVDEVGVNQNKYINSSGSNGEYFLSVGGNYANKLFIGFTVGIQRSDYELNKTHSEYENNDEMLDFHSFDFTEYETQSGTGYNFKIGAIYRPTDYLRIGAAVHTPTFYKMEYTWYNKMNSEFDDGETYSSSSDNYSFSYNLITPMRIETGAAWQIQDKAIISADYERVDYSMAKLEDKEGRNIYEMENDSLNNTLGAANNIRLGAEYKFDNFYVRGGYALYQSPYSEQHSNFQKDKEIYSGGIGYREGSFFIDASFQRSIVTENKLLYRQIYNLQNQATKIENNFDRFIVTIGLRL